MLAFSLGRVRVLDKSFGVLPPQQQPYRRRRAAGEVQSILCFLLLSQESESYEVLYNYGTLLIYFDKLPEAESVLLRALRMGRRDLHEGDEVEPDLAELGEEPELDPVRVQLAYTRSARGDREGAVQVLQRVLLHRGSSQVVSAIATNNLVAARGCTEALDSYRRWGRRAPPSQTQGDPRGTPREAHRRAAARAALQPRRAAAAAAPRTSPAGIAP